MQLYMQHPMKATWEQGGGPETSVKNGVGGRGGGGGGGGGGGRGYC